MTSERDRLVSLNHSEQLTKLLQSDNPFDKSNNYRVPRYSAVALRHLDKMETSWMLAPRVVGFVRKFRGLGISDKELIEIGFIEALEFTDEFQSANRHLNVPFSVDLARTVDTSIKKEIARRHGVLMTEVEKVKLYYDCRRILQRETGHNDDNFEPIHGLMQTLYPDKFLRYPDVLISTHRENREFLSTMMSIHNAAIQLEHPETMRLALDQQEQEQDLLRSNERIEPLLELTHALSTLPITWQEILDEYVIQGKTLDEIGAKRGKSREAIRQKKEKALAKLRHKKYRIKSAARGEHNPTASEIVEKDYIKEKWEKVRESALRIGLVDDKLNEDNQVTEEALQTAEVGNTSVERTRWDSGQLIEVVREFARTNKVPSKEEYPPELQFWNLITQTMSGQRNAVMQPRSAGDGVIIVGCTKDGKVKYGHHLGLPYGVQGASIKHQFISPIGYLLVKRPTINVNFAGFSFFRDNLTTFELESIYQYELQAEGQNLLFYGWASQKTVQVVFRTQETNFPKGFLQHFLPQAEACKQYGTVLYEGDDLQTLKRKY